MRQDVAGASGAGLWRWAAAAQWVRRRCRRLRPLCNLWSGQRCAQSRFSRRFTIVEGGNYAADGYRKSELAYVEVSPVAPLENRWYVVQLASMPAGLALPKYTEHQRLPDGKLGARFSPGSRPTVTSVRVCERKGGNTSVILEFSERITQESNVADVVRLADVGSSTARPCTVEMPPEAVSPHGTSAKVVRFACEAVDVGTSSFRLTVADSVSSPSGGTLESPGNGRTAIEQTIPGARLTPWGDGCRIAR